MNEGNLKRKGVIKMKELKTITEHEILKLAWFKLLDKMRRELEINEEFKKEYGKTDSISKYRMKKLEEQIEEIENRIVEIEKEN